MSYILDALKKSEHERTQGKVPDLHAMHAPLTGTHKGRPLWPYLVGIVVLLNVLVLWFWMRPQSEPQPHGQAGAPTAPMVDKMADEMADEVTDDTAARSVDTRAGQGAVLPAVPVVVQAPAQEAVASGAAVPVAGKETGSAAQESKTPPAPPVQAEPTAGRVIIASTPLTDASGNLLDTDTAAASASDPGQGEALASPPAARDQGASVAAFEEEVQPVSELPQTIKRKLPRMSYAGHVYSDNPQRRSVLINGRKLREGYVVEGDLVLEEIRNDHAVFSLDGYRFRINMLRDWPME